MVQTDRWPVRPRRSPGHWPSPWRDWLHRQWRELDRFARLQWETYHHCRECGEEVKFTEEVCPQCGISGPVVVPLGVPAAIGVFVALVLGLLALSIV